MDLEVREAKEDTNIKRKKVRLNESTGEEFKNNNKS